jgi:hypothetical protein
MDGCGSESELCDSQVLLDRVLPFAISEERYCASVSTDEVLDDNEEDIIPEPKTAETEANPLQKWGMFGVAILSATVGGIATCFLMRQHCQNAYSQASMLERELSMVENRTENNYASNHEGVHNGERTNTPVSSDYIEESDEDRII